MPVKFPSGLLVSPNVLVDRLVTDAQKTFPRQVSGDLIGTEVLPEVTLDQGQLLLPVIDLAIKACVPDLINDFLVYLKYHQLFSYTNNIFTNLEIVGVVGGN